MEFDGSSRLIQDLFDPVIINGRNTPKTYVYVFSKVIDGHTYYKIGEGKRTISRVSSAQTYLMRFKIEYLIFYGQSPYREEYNTQTEKLIHKIFRHKYDTYVIHFKSGNPSEWYRPPKNKTREFFQDMLGIIGVVRPKPIEAYKMTSTDLTDIMKSLKSTRSYEKYAVDLKKQLEDIKVVKKANQKNRESTVGNQAYYQNRMIGHIFKDDGRSWIITNVLYEKTIKAYVVEYEPSRITKQTSELDLAGYADRIEEIFEILGRKVSDKLGLKTNYDYYINSNDE